MYALGSAIPAFTLSLVSHPSVAGENSKSNAMDYSVIMIGKFAGNALGLPTMTVLWAKGIGIGGALLGLPYFASGVCAIFDRHELSLILVSWCTRWALFSSLRSDLELPNLIRNARHCEHQYKRWIPRSNESR